MISTLALRILDWAIISLSIFNTIALLWLGFTVLLNAERRTAGTWLAGGGLILCGLFFVGHTAVVGRKTDVFDFELGFWWQLSWLMTICAPFLWYLGSIWYTGVFQTQRHRVGLAVTACFGIAGLVLLSQNSLPNFHDATARAPAELIGVQGVPVVAIAYPLYSVLCFSLSIAALYHPHVSDRFMGDVARRRARPWLVAASLVLIAIGVAFGMIMIWFLQHVQARPESLFLVRRLPLFMAMDLLLESLVTIGVLLTGQAIVSYEIFTGKTLPRRGLRRYWRRSLIFAAGYGLLVGGSLSIPNINPISTLLLATVLITLFYALVSWRTYAEREANMAQLRPFVASQGLYERLVRAKSDEAAQTDTDHAPEVDIEAPFVALCVDVLGAQRVFLVALGPLAAFVGSPLAHPRGTPLPVLNGLPSRLQSPTTMCLPLDANEYNGAIWAVPLWSERGLIGVLLLGPKRDGGIYTQEEIELARATGERLLDTQASAVMADRLMMLQRQRLAESHVIDNRTRRTLHDDILPQIHTAMLLLGMADICANKHEHDSRNEAMQLLANAHREIANLLHTMPPASASLVAQHGLIGALKHATESDLAHTFDEVTLQIDPKAEQAAQALPALTAEVILFAAREAIRNAARYGRNGDASRPLRLMVEVSWHAGLVITIEDDGVGLGTVRQSDNKQAVTSGHGLALHGTMMAVVGGALTTESIANTYTRVSLTLPQNVVESAPAL
jgi:signal transduction histidine kinase